MTTNLGGFKGESNKFGAVHHCMPDAGGRADVEKALDSVDLL